MNDSLTGGGDGQTPVHAQDLEGLRLGWIRTQGELNDVEARNLQAGRIWAFRTRRPRSVEQLLDDRWLFELHRRSFGDVWSWAGTPRLRITSIGIAPVEVIRATRDALLDASAQIEADPSGERSRAIVADLHFRLAAIHPFANGNGRTLRLHSDLLARTLGTPAPTWGGNTPDVRERYLDALRRADAGDPEALRSFLWS